MRAPAARADPPLNDLAAIRPHEMRAAAAAFAALRMVLITRLALRLLRSGDGRRRCWRGHRRRRRRDDWTRGGRRRWLLPRRVRQRPCAAPIALRSLARLGS